MKQPKGVVIAAIAVVVVVGVGLGVGVAFYGGSGDDEISDPAAGVDDSTDVIDAIDVIDVTTFDPPNPASSPGTSSAPHNEFATFEDITETAGLDYETRDHGRNVVDAHGPFVVDFDNDGYEDLLLIGGDRPTLFENTGGAYEQYRIFDHSEAMVAHFFDYNNNGYRDLLLGSPNEAPIFYENEGGEFHQRDVGFDTDMGYPTTVVSADFTGNGCLDVYIGDWGTVRGSGELPMEAGPLLEVVQGHPDHRPATDFGSSNHLFGGDCEQFEEITDRAGVGGSEFTLAASAVDFTGNGHVDIHVGNDWTGDYIYENQGDGTFESIDLGPDSDRNAMASVAKDVTGTHRHDLFVTNVYYEDHNREQSVPVTRIALPFGNNLFVNEGGGEFRDVAPEHGLEKGSWGWAATVDDYTNDGHLDIIHASSFSDVPVIDEHPAIFAPPQVWKGTADSWEKVDGHDLGFPEHNIRGLVRVDYQNNGALDIVTVGNPSQQDVPGVQPGANRSFLYENTHETTDSLQLWVRNPGGLDTNAGVYVETDERTIYRETNSRGDLLSQNSRLIHVGTANEMVERVVVDWPDGTVTAYEGLESGNRYILTPEQVEPVE